MNTKEAAERFITDISDDLAGLQSFDVMEMYREILSYGKTPDSLSMDEMNEDNRVKGCASEVHIRVDLREQRVYIRTYSNSQIIKGILHIICETFNGLPAHDFLQHADSLMAIFLKKIDVHSTLTPTRTNSIGTIMSMIHASVEQQL